MTGMLSRYRLYVFSSHFCVWMNSLKDAQPFLVLIVSIIPSRWWCVWASLQLFASWSQCSASKLRWGKKENSLLVYFLINVWSDQHAWFRVEIIYVWQLFICFLTLVWRHIIPRCALCLLHGHVHLWTGAGPCPSLSICKYNQDIDAFNMNVSPKPFYMTVYIKESSNIIISH